MSNDAPPGPDGPRNPGTLEPVRTRWSPDERPAAEVVLAVAAATGLEPAALPPLHATVDADALNRILASARETGVEDVRVTFEYAGTEVAVDGTGGIAVYPGPE
jgi:hypothetical protein